MKIVTIVGARPQFIKAAAVSGLIAQRGDVSEVLGHTGQHVDENMPGMFFEMEIHLLDHHLGVGGASHGAMTERQPERIEEVLMREQPDTVFVLGARPGSTQ